MILWFCIQKLEGRVASDEDLKLSDLLRYYERDSQAALVRDTHTHTPIQCMYSNPTHNRKIPTMGRESS